MEYDQNPPLVDPAAPESITFTIKDQHNSETAFKVKRTTQFYKVFPVYCTNNGKDLKEVRFLFEGARVQPDDTPDSLEMEDQDVMDCFQEQQGGGSVAAKDELVNLLQQLTIEEGVHDQALAIPNDNHSITFTISGRIKEHTRVFKMKKKTPFSKVFWYYCELTGRKLSDTRFIYDGSRIQPSDTPESLEMVEGRMVEAHDEQYGGAKAKIDTMEYLGRLQCSTRLQLRDRISRQ